MTTQRSREGFQTINPPLPTFEAEGIGDNIRGYVLSRQERDSVAPFYVLQLTEPYTKNGVSLPAGRLVAVPEVASIAALAAMTVHYLPTGPDGAAQASWGHEVIIEPFASSEEGWQHLLHAKRVLGSQAEPAIDVPPAYPLLAKMGTELERSIAARAQLEQQQMPPLESEQSDEDEDEDEEAEGEAEAN